MIQGTEWFSLQDLRPSLFKEWKSSPIYPVANKTLRGAEWKSIEDEMLLFMILEASILFKKEGEVGYFDSSLDFISLGTESEITIDDFENYGVKGISIVNSEKIKNLILSGDSISIIALEEHYSSNESSKSFLSIEGEQKNRLLKVAESLSNKDLGALSIVSSDTTGEKLYCVLNLEQLKSYKNGAWVSIATPPSSEDLMTRDEVESLTLEEWSSLEEEVFLVSLLVGDEYLTSYTENKFTYDKTPIIKDVRFYILNTTATINLEFRDNILQGELDDADKSSVQYRVIINNKNLYPENGEFTSLEDPLVPIELQISSKDIIIGENNTLRVEFKDGWGAMDFWEQTFMGEMRGLLFYDEQGHLYSTEVGEILKTLDFGTITAGTTSQEHRVKLKNLTSSEYENITLNTIIPNELGSEIAQENIDNQKVQFQLSHSDSPFVPNQELKYLSALPNQEFEFFVRISTSIDAVGVQEGLFDIQVIAKPKV